MKVKLDDIIMALEFVNSGIDNTAYFNSDTQEIIYQGDYIDNINEEELEEIYNSCLWLPTKNHIDEYNMMEEFIETIEDVRIYNQLYSSIQGKGAFRRFKDTCFNFGIIDDWYKFRDEQYKQIAINWCKNNNIDFI